MKERFKEALDNSPIITAIKSDEGLTLCRKTDSRIVFILYGDICSISDIVDSVKQSGKMAMVHVDLINGLSSKEIVVDFIKKYTKADGIITTRPALIKRASELGLATILRIFAIDSLAYENIEKQVRAANPDVIEILPGMMPKIISRICSQLTIPVIAGGLVSEKSDVMELLKAGAGNISTTNKDVWFI